MKDAFGREIRYLRLSVTERCTLKCAYCRAGEGLCPKSRELDTESLLRIVRVLAGLGVDKVRLTGGEPLLRRDLPELIAGIRAVPGIREIALTTNAQMLAEQAKTLKTAGLDRVNISLDSLQADRYCTLTGGGALKKVFSGIDAAFDAGLTPVKLNVVLMRGRNDGEVDDFIALTRDRPLHVRFIELMPLGSTDRTGERIPSEELIAARPYLVPVLPADPSQPSRDYRIEGYAGRVGFISPVSHRFCADCNRVRVMSDGMLRPCLGDNGEVSLKAALAEADDAALMDVIRSAIWNKPKNHSFDAAFHADKNMRRIGG